MSLALESDPKPSDSKQEKKSQEEPRKDGRLSTDCSPRQLQHQITAEDASLRADTGVRPMLCVVRA